MSAKNCYVVSVYAVGNYPPGTLIRFRGSRRMYAVQLDGSLRVFKM